jgi:hypothetical protein
MARLAASSMVRSQHRLIALRQVVGTLLLLVTGLMVAVTPVLAKNVLSGASVSPRSGTTATTFVFSVHYAGKPATSVVAHVGTLTVALGRVSGTAANGTWRGSRRLPVGTRSVTFSATAIGNVADLPAGQVTVNAVPTPTPAPTARPTPKPPVATARPATPRPTAKTTSTPSRSAKASGTPGATRATPPATPVAVGGATEPSPSAGAGSPASDDEGRILPAVLLGLFVILGVGGIALLTGRRQAEERPMPSPDGSPDEPPDPAFVRRAAAVGAAEGTGDAGRPRQRAAWEVYSSLDNQPLGTVDEMLPEESAAGAIEASTASPTDSELESEAAPAADARGHASHGAADATAGPDERPQP